MTKKFSQYRQWVISVTAIIIIAVGTVLLVAIAQGYTFDSVHRQFNKTGLVLIDSTPGGALISLNDKVTNKKTPYRYTSALVGNLTILLQKPDYRDWLLNTTVTPGEVTFVDYALLLPSILQQQNVSQPQPYDNVIQSANHDKTVAFSHNPLSIYSLSSAGQAKLVYQPNSTDQVVEILNMQISSSGDRLLFTQKKSDGSLQVVVLELSSGKIDNLTADFGLAFDNIQFNQRDSLELFWLEGDVLKKIHLNNHSISSNLVSSVANLSVQKDRLLIVHTPIDSHQQLTSYDLSGNNERKIVQLPISQAGYQVGFIPSRYAEYISVLNTQTTQLQLLKNPYQHENSQSSVTELGNGVTKLIVSPTNRFVVVDQNDQFRSLDLEFNADSSIGTSLVGLEGWDWYDDYHLIVRQAKQLRMIDFDGQNNQVLTPISDVVGMSIQRDDKAVLPLNTTGNLFRLFFTKK